MDKATFTELNPEDNFQVGELLFLGDHTPNFPPVEEDFDGGLYVYPDCSDWRYLNAKYEAAVYVQATAREISPVIFLSDIDAPSHVESSDEKLCRIIAPNGKVGCIDSYYLCRKSLVHAVIR